jgi:hypothetical protein
MLLIGERTPGFGRGFFICWILSPVERDALYKKHDPNKPVLGLDSRMDAGFPPARSLGRLAVSVSALVRFHLNALFLTRFHVVKVRVDACLIRIKRILVLSARIDRRDAGLGSAAAARKRNRAQREEYPRHWPRSVGEPVVDSSSDFVKLHDLLVINAAQR